MSDNRFAVLKRYETKLDKFKYTGLTNKEGMELLLIAKRLYHQANNGQQWHNECQRKDNEIKKLKKAASKPRTISNNKKQFIENNKKSIE